MDSWTCWGLNLVYLPIASRSTRALRQRHLTIHVVSNCRLHCLSWGVVCRKLIGSLTRPIESRLKERRDRSVKFSEWYRYGVLSDFRRCKTVSACLPVLRTIHTFIHNLDLASSFLKTGSMSCLPFPWFFLHKRNQRACIPLREKIDHFISTDDAFSYVSIRVSTEAS